MAAALGHMPYLQVSPIVYVICSIVLQSTHATKVLNMWCARLPKGNAGLRIVCSPICDSPSSFRLQELFLITRHWLVRPLRGCLAAAVPCGFCACTCSQSGRFLPGLQQLAVCHSTELHSGAFHVCTVVCRDQP